MKKLISLATAAVFVVSLTACTSRNNRNYNTGTNQGSSAGQNKNVAANYKDGMYTALGDSHANGNENAVVTVRNGKIANIVLTSLDTNGNVRNASTTGAATDTNNIGTTQGTGAGNNTIGNAITGRTGTTAGSPGYTGSVGSTGNVGAQGTATGFGTSGNTVNSATDNRANTNNTTGTTGTTGITGNMANVGNNAATAVTSTWDQLRTRLTGSMVQNQTHDVNLDNLDGTTTPVVNNWKLAVRRALDQARK